MCNFYLRFQEKKLSFHFNMYFRFIPMYQVGQRLFLLSLEAEFSDVLLPGGLP